mgnify:FL=1
MKRQAADDGGERVLSHPDERAWVPKFSEVVA